MQKCVMKVMIVAKKIKKNKKRKVHGWIDDGWTKGKMSSNLLPWEEVLNGMLDSWSSII